MAGDEMKSKLEREIRHIAAIEDAFKALGKTIYVCWADDGKHDFNALMEKFHKTITKLKEKTK